MPLEHQRESLLNSLAEAHNFEYLQLLQQHEDGDDKAKRDVIDGIREDLEDWFADASALVTDADGDANVTGQLVRMIPNLLDIVTRFAPTFSW